VTGCPHFIWILPLILKSQVWIVEVMISNCQSFQVDPSMENIGKPTWNEKQNFVLEDDIPFPKGQCSTSSSMFTLRGLGRNI
jgi:hypothetical protein